MDASAFASARRERLGTADDTLRTIVQRALAHQGERSWDQPILDAASTLWTELFLADAPNLYPDARLRAFRQALHKSLQKTSASTSPTESAQIDRVTKWVNTYAANDAAHQSIRGTARKQKEWVTQGDDKVRKSHRAVAGTRVAANAKFTVGGSKLRYPGEPAGDPKEWIECRCLLNQVDTAVTAAAGFDERTTVVIVALPATDDAIEAASSEDIAHMTLAFLGDVETLPINTAAISSAIVAYAESITGPITESVSGRATLGDDGAEVVLIDASSMAQIRDGLVALPDVATALTNAEQFPVWLPHVTLGYPDTPALEEYVGTEVVFDRFGLLVGNERFEYVFGNGEVPEVAAVTAAAVVEEAPVEVPAEPVEEEVEVDDPVEIPFHGVAAPLGVESGDRRMFAVGGESFRTFPFPITYQRASTEGHAGSVRVGRIDRMWTDENNLVQYEGVFNGVPEVAEVIEGIIDGSIRGVSVDVDKWEYEIPEQNFASEEEAIAAMVNPPVEVMSKYRVASLSVVAIPAFEEAYIALGECDCEPDFPADAPDDGADMTEEEFNALVASGGVVEAFAPGTKDGPGWITNPQDTARLRKYWVKGEGAAKIKWGVGGDFNRCRLQLGKYITNPAWLAGACANMHKEALGVWPGREATVSTASLIASGAAPAPAFSVVQDDDIIMPYAWFTDPQLDGPTPITITPEGRVFGHLATWGVCHIGIQGVCTTAPSSNTDYSYYRQGLVLTDEGPVFVGHITMETGHASKRASAAAAMAHYDNTGAVVADVVSGEDAHGIWFAGALRPAVGAEQRYELRASSVSGDWRQFGANGLELVAALAVNLPGFTNPRVEFAADGNRQLSLIAAGALTPVTVAQKEYDGEQVLGLVDAVIAELANRQERTTKALAARERLTAAARIAKIERARERIRG